MNAQKHFVVIRSRYSTGGGVERVALSLVRGLLDRGVAVTLLTMPHQQWPLTHFELSIVALGWNRAHRLVQKWSFNQSVNRYLKQHPADYVLSLDKVTTFSHLHAGGGTHKSFLAIKNQSSNIMSKLLRYVSPYHRYVLYMERCGFERNPLLQKVRCNSRLVRADILRDYNVPEEKLILVHSGIRWKEMESIYCRREEVAAELCARHNLDRQWNMLLFLGSGFARKRLDVAIDGLAGLPADYHLVVVGKGSIQRYRHQAKQLGLLQRIHFLGPQPQGWRYASMCRALVLPSSYDPFGGAAAEGHAMGLPVLVSDKTGYADWVTHGQNGIILDTPMTASQIKSAFHALMHLIEHPSHSPDELRQHARNVDDDVIFEKLLGDFLSI